MQEQRSQSRIDCDIILNKVEDGHTKVCRAQNLSLGGMKLQRVAEAYKPEGESVQLQFALPGEDDPIWVSGEKVYEQNGDVVVRFTNISHGDFIQLRNWLRDRLGAADGSVDVQVASVQ